MKTPKMIYITTNIKVYRTKFLKTLQIDKCFDFITKKQKQALLNIIISEENIKHQRKKL